MKTVTLLHRNGDVTIRGGVTWIETYSIQWYRPLTHVLLGLNDRFTERIERFDDIDFVRVVEDR